MILKTCNAKAFLWLLNVYSWSYEKYMIQHIFTTKDNVHFKSNSNQNCTMHWFSTCYRHLAKIKVYNYLINQFYLLVQKLPSNPWNSNIETKVHIRIPVRFLALSENINSFLPCFFWPLPVFHQFVTAK